MSRLSRGIIITIAIVAILAAISVIFFLKPPARPQAAIAGSGRMKIQSPQFDQNAPIPAIFTCDGDNISPPLAISGVPEEAKSLALIVDDPDAPAGTWVHWTVWNIPPQTPLIEAGNAPAGSVQGVTSSGRAGYGGPCPPSGTHHYFFKLYALDAVLDLSAKAKAAELEAKMVPHVLDKAGLIGVYGR